MLQKLLTRIIARSFPELRDEYISIDYADLPDAYLQYGRYKKNEGFYIEVSSSCMVDVAEEILIGGIVHELCHMVHDLNESLYEALLYKCSKRYRRVLEINTDIEAIRRGYFKELFHLAEYIRLNFEWDQENGLHPFHMLQLYQNMKGPSHGSEVLSIRPQNSS